MSPSGLEVVDMVGQRPHVLFAQSMVHLGIDLESMHSRSSLRDALRRALRLLRDADTRSAERVAYPCTVAEARVDARASALAFAWWESR